MALVTPPISALRQPTVAVVATAVVVAALFGTTGCGSDTERVDELDDHDRIVEDTDRLRAGMFIRIDDDLMIGAHPGVFDEIRYGDGPGGDNSTTQSGLELEPHIDPSVVDGGLVIDVERIDPGSVADFPPEGHNVEAFTDAIEISAPRLEGEQYVAAAFDTAFYTAISVPDDMDPDHLTPMMYVYGGLAEHADGEAHRIEPGWRKEPAQGIYDREEGLFLIETPYIGSPEEPVYVVLTEHPVFETEATEPALLDILDVYFPRLEQRADEQSSPLQTARGALHEPGHEVRLDVSCQFGHGIPGLQPDHDCQCNAWEQKIEEAFFAALPYYKQLDRSPRPNLSTSTGSKFRSHTTYKYNIRDETLSYRCRGSHGVYFGWVKGKSGNARTCASAPDPWKTTRHELFHAFQADFTRRRGDLWVSEGGARVAEAIGSENNPEDFEVHRSVPADFVSCNGASNADLRPVDVGLEYEGAPGDVTGNVAYSAEAFWMDLLFRMTAGSFDDLDSLSALAPLGRLYDDYGRDTEDAEAFIADESPFDSLRDAHWQWAKNAAFEGDLTFPDGTYGHRCEPHLDSFAFDVPTVSYPHQDSLQMQMPPPGGVANTLHSSTLHSDSAILVELQFEDVQPDPVEFYEIEWGGTNGQLYTDTMQSGEDGDCVDIPGEPVHVVQQHPYTGDSADDTAYLVNADDDDFTAYLLIQNPEPNTQLVSISEPEDYPHYLEPLTYIPDDTIPEKGTVGAMAAVNASHNVIDYEWTLENVETEGSGDVLDIDSGADVTSVEVDNICPASFNTPWAQDLPVVTLRVDVRDELGVEASNERDIEVEPAIIDAEVTGLRTEPPPPDGDADATRIQELIDELPFDSTSTVGVDDNVWPIERTQYLLDATTTQGFAVNVAYDPNAAANISFNDELYPWGVALRAGAERCEAADPVDLEDLEIRPVGTTEWKDHDAVFGSESFETGFGSYQHTYFEVGHTEYDGEIWVSVPAPCFMQADAVQSGASTAPIPEGVNIANYPECLHPEDLAEAHNEFQDAQQPMFTCIGGEFDAAGGGGPSSPMSLFDPCMPFDDMPGVPGFGWEDLVTPPSYTDLSGAWCSGIGSQDCETGTMRIDIIGQQLSSSREIGIEAAHEQMRGTGGQFDPVTPGEPDAMFLYWNAIATNIVADFGPMGQGWEQLAEATDDQRFRLVSHQQPLEPLNYGFGAAVYTASAWGPDFVNGDIDFDEYLDHVIEGAMAGTLLGAAEAVNRYAPQPPTGYIR